MSSRDLSPDELASAYVDGALDESDAAAVHDDPELMARVEEFRRAAAAVGAPVEAPGDVAEQAVAAALAGHDAAKVVSLDAARLRPRNVRLIAGVAAGIAVGFLVASVVGLRLGGGDSSEGEPLAAVQASAADLMPADAPAAAEVAAPRPDAVTHDDSAAAAPSEAAPALPDEALPEADAPGPETSALTAAPEPEAAAAGDGETSSAGAGDVTADEAPAAAAAPKPSAARMDEAAQAEPEVAPQPDVPERSAASEPEVMAAESAPATAGGAAEATAGGADIAPADMAGDMAGDESVDLAAADRADSYEAEGSMAGAAASAPCGLPGTIELAFALGDYRVLVVRSDDGRLVALDGDTCEQLSPSG